MRRRFAPRRATAHPLPVSAFELHRPTYCGGANTPPLICPPIVGYQNKGFENSGYTIVANTFLPVGGATDAMTLEDIKVNDAFVNSKLVFMTTGGANAKTTWDGKSVNKSYVYWTEDDAEDGAGWYLDADVDATVNCNETVTFDPGDGFLVNRMSSEASATITTPSAL